MSVRSAALLSAKAAPSVTGTMDTDPRLLRLVQAASGLCIAVFLSLHLINTAFALAGPAAYDSLQIQLRLGYQQPLLEVLLLLAIGVHVGSALVSLWRRRRSNTGLPSARNSRARWHRIAGYFLLAVITGHIMAVRGASFLYDVYPGFAGLSYTLNALPEVFYPYYFLLAMAGFYHLINGVPIALARLRAPASMVAQLRLRNRPMAVATLTVALVMALSLLALGGVLFPIADPFDNGFAGLAEAFLDG